jgi:hypothetical protein
MTRGTLEEAPRRVVRGGRSIVSPLDVASGGTWVGFNDAGLAVAITNQETEWTEKPGRSRGLLAMDLLEDFDSAEEAKSMLLDPEVRSHYRRGNINVMDGRSAWHIVWDREIFCRELAPGGHIVTTLTRFPGVDWTERAEKMWPRVEARVRRGEQLLAGCHVGGVDECLEGLKALSRDHGEGRSPGSLCYHPDKDNFVQTSSTIIAVSEKIEGSRVLYCPGNPCENEYRDYSSVLRG